MITYTGDGLGDFYYKVLRDLTNHGRKIPTRYGECIEFTEPVTFEYERPGYCWMHIPGRNWNPFLPMAEVIWILMGRGDVDWISYYSKSLLEFVDEENPKHFHGAYGFRMRRAKDPVMGSIDQIAAVIQTLKKDNFSRRAIITLWDPYLDTVFESKDHPCNNWVQFLLRDGKLEMTVVMRSNDLITGTPVNAVQFTHLQALVAGELGVGMGRFTYVLNNLHYYTERLKPKLALLLTNAFSDENPVARTLNFKTFKQVDVNDCFDYITHGISGPREFDSSYLRQFGDALRIYRYIKEKTLPAERIAMMIQTKFGTLLQDLMMDFYEPSENTLAQEVLKLLRESDDDRARAVREGAA